MIKLDSIVWFILRHMEIWRDETMPVMFSGKKSEMICWEMYNFDRSFDLLIVMSIYDKILSWYFCKYKFDQLILELVGHNQAIDDSEILIPFCGIDTAHLWSFYTLLWLVCYRGDFGNLEIVLVCFETCQVVGDSSCHTVKLRGADGYWRIQCRNCGQDKSDCLPR